MLRRFGNILDVVARALRVRARGQIGRYSPQRRPRAGRIGCPGIRFWAARRLREFHHRYDLTACIGCGRCAGNCPAGCLHVGKERVPGRRGFQVSSFTIDYAGCLQCGLCGVSCPAECIVMDGSHEPTGYSRERCTVDYSRLPAEVAWGLSTLYRVATVRSEVTVLPAHKRLDQYGGENGK